MSKTNVLLVCANPRGTDPLRTAAEDRTLRESLRLSPKRADFEVETLNAVTIDDLRRALLWKPFHVVHFSGHGTQHGLIFEDSQGALVVPQSAALAELLQRRGVQVALLNACYSLSVGKISAIGLDYTIASAGPISDAGAIEFARGFYDALGAGTNVPDAYAEGMSAAKLKGLGINAILLRRGEDYVPQQVAPPTLDQTVASQSAPRSLLGIAIDTSGSMQASIDNKSQRSTTRFSEVKAAVTDIGKQVQDSLREQASSIGDSFHVFLYAFGLRVGSGIADLASLSAAARRIDVDYEVESRRREYEARARQQASQYSDLASLARSFGYGGLVDSVTSAAEDSIRERIIGEVASLTLNEADRLGDTTLTAERLAALLDDTPASPDARALEHVLFGATPMAEAARQIRDRFRRLAADKYDYRTLLVISDGEPTDGDPREALGEVRSSGVDIVACFVTSEDIADPRTLHGSTQDHWSKGARLMWDIASPIDESGPAAKFLLSNGWSIEKNAKLFVQVNHSDVLKEFAHVATAHFTNKGDSMLPRGQ